MVPWTVFDKTENDSPKGAPPQQGREGTPMDVTDIKWLSIWCTRYNTQHIYIITLTKKKRKFSS
jgi:hypothetical protein